MDCTRSKQWMHDYLDDELDELSLPEFKQHLEAVNIAVMSLRS
ncbi:zf-HC2 domain-containing protein [Caldalkalibacillus mannanilyticus]|nr:zf-HC2 domain-containing protein [Caldalkalibacillus mannanilyticus]